MKIEVRNRCPHYDSYRAARVQSLFNAETGQAFDLDADLAIDDDDWKIGVVVGPSGSGKTSTGRLILGDDALWTGGEWPTDAPIVDAIAPNGDFDAVTAALSAVGLGSVPSWLRPYGVLSNGEKFRAELARIVAEEPTRVVIDEFTSVVDRQIAKIGALAFQKAWRRTAGKRSSCHATTTSSTGSSPTGSMTRLRACSSGMPQGGVFDDALLSNLKFGRSTVPTGTSLSRITI